MIIKFLIITFERIITLKRIRIFVPKFILGVKMKRNLKYFNLILVIYYLSILNLVSFMHEIYSFFYSFTLLWCFGLLHLDPLSFLSSLWFGVSLISKYSASDQSEESNDSENDCCGNETFSFSSRIFSKVGKLFYDLFGSRWRDGFNVEDFLAFDFIDESPISFGCKSRSSFIKLSFEKINMSLLNWIDCGKDIPVNVDSAWWGCNRSFVYPSIVEIGHFHQ